MDICLRDNNVGVVFAYWYNNLFSRRFFSGHIEFWFTLLSIIVSNIVNLEDLAGEQSGKSILNFKNILNVIFCSLSI